MLKKRIVRIFLFILIGIILLSTVSSILVNHAADYRAWQWFRSFYSEKENSLDAVYCGSSVTYSFWMPTVAWERYGIAVHPYASNSQPLEVAEYLIKEARKTQPDALFIIPTNSFGGITEANMHWLLDYMPFSRNKVDLVQALVDMGAIDKTERWEYLFPIVRYHTRWTELTEQDFDYTADDIKRTSTYVSFLTYARNIVNSFRFTEKTVELPEVTQKALESLLDYCDDEQINVLFVTVPNAITDEAKLAGENTIEQMVQERGYPVLDLFQHIEDMELDITTDYYNPKHTNIHGAIKYTDYLAQYLVENYGFEDKRGDPAYSSWDEAHETYTEEYALFNVLDFEWRGDSRDWSLAAPDPSVTVNGRTLTVSWEAVPDADGYAVYRKWIDEEPSQWKQIAKLSKDELSYEDTDCEIGETYDYHVVAYTEKDGVISWGKYDFLGVPSTGVRGKTTLDAPELLSLEGSENDLTLTWTEVEGADGYAVFRQVYLKDLFEIADVGAETSFTDTNMLSGVPCQYTVKAYYLNEFGNRVMSSYDEIGLLYVPELEPSPIEATVTEDGLIKLSWDRVEGIEAYRICRRTEDSPWEQITVGTVEADMTSLLDITAQAGVPYSYRLEAFLTKDDGEEYKVRSVSPEWVEAERALYQTTMPKITCIEQTGNCVHIGWEAVDDVYAYRIYRRDRLANGTWSEWDWVKASTSELDYMETPPASGEYEYIVRSLFMLDEVRYYGELDGKSGYGIDFRAATE